jgi:two-component system sensor histidine kinase/response regulator
VLIQISIQVPMQRIAAVMQFRTLATVLAANSADAAADEDGVTATAILASLRGEANVEQTLLISNNGRVIASFSPTGHIESEGVLGERDGWMQTALAQTLPTVRYSGLIRAEVVSPIIQDGELLGHIYLSGSLQPLREQFEGFLTVMGIATVLALVMAWLLAHRMRRRITAPLDGLTAAMRAITSNSDYSLQVPIGARDEAGGLLEDFNAMLAQIDERDRELQRQRDMLETLAAERSRALDQANTRLRDMTARSADAVQQVASTHKGRREFLEFTNLEIRASLNHAVSMTELLLETAPDIRPVRLADSIQSSVDSLLAIANEIAGYCGDEPGKKPLDMTEFDIRRLMEETAQLFARRAQDKNLELVVTVDPQIQNLLRGDAARLRQVVMNLISNAIKFTMRGFVVIRVKQRVREQGRIQLRIEVSDTGIGIRRELHTSMFAANSLADASGARKYGNGGRGVTVSRQLVEQMGGRISVDSEFGRGSTFVVDLGLEESAERCLSGTELALDPGRRLLVVDDSPIKREALQSQLAGFGMSVESAGDGETALNLIDGARQAGAPFELLIVDWQMPGMDGIELIRRVRARETGEPVPAIVLGPIAQELSEQMRNELAPVSRLVKPARQTALRRATVQMLGSRTRRLADLSILLLEADTASRDEIREMLRHQDCLVVTADSARQAIELLAERSFDFVLVSDEMPGMAGKEAISGLRLSAVPRPGRETRVIGLTAGNNSRARERALQMGMDDCLARPVTAAQLLAKLASSRAKLAAGGSAITAPEDLGAVLMPR